MRTIKEMCDLLGLTHRTFRYYDSIGLLKPAAHTKAGYRLYDNESVIRMVKIRVLADIGYELTEIKKILDDPGYDLKMSLEKRCNEIKESQERSEHQLEVLSSVRSKGLDGIVRERLKQLGS